MTRNATQPAPETASAAKTKPCAVPADATRHRPTCPICSAAGTERKQKWFCTRCGQLIATCCD